MGLLRTWFFFTHTGVTYAGWLSRYVATRTDLLLDHKLKEDNRSEKGRLSASIPLLNAELVVSVSTSRSLHR